MSNQRNSQKVLEAIQDLHNLEQIVTRENLSSSLAMPMSVIDASLAYLVDCGHIIRIQRGVFRPSIAHSPARMISQSELSDGCVLIEIGDDISLTLTPKEARIIGTMLQGRAIQYAQIESGQAMIDLANTIKLQIASTKPD